MRRLLVCSPLVLMLAGCGAYYTEYWVRPGGSEAAFEAAASRCESDALARFPPMTFGQKGYFATPNTWCTPTAGGTNCSIINPGYLPQAQSAADTNEGPRENAVHQCLLAGGWQIAVDHRKYLAVRGAEGGKGQRELVEEFWGHVRGRMEYEH